LNSIPSIWHRDLTADLITKIRKASTNPLLMCVEHSAEKQFGAGINQFNLHEKKDDKYDLKL
jgi:hypothetical protein